MKIIRNFPWLPFGWDGMAIRPFIFLRKGGESLLNHELIHLEQQERHGLAYYLRYAFSKTFRFDMELEAYMRGSELDRPDAERMAQRYVMGAL